MTFLVLISVWVFSLISYPDQEKWELRRNENGIAIYSRKLSDASFKQIKVECELPGTTSQLVQVLRDVPHHPDWVYATSKATLIKKKTENNFIYLTETDMPWPVTDRDLVVETIIYPIVKGNLHIEVKSLPDYVPINKNFIRIPYSEATWDIFPLPDNKLKITYTFSINPGGSIPSWLVNASVVTGPYNTFMKLREILSKNQ
ncbi:START domain-containing protein [Adhaeribacter radiodurans]|uniref:START domain-containing protein n=1 Tax=Adhaeribacter radiodurans TaxID=2745197 RepID=A0A7L7L4Q3_9BACT|nr:START domain-containing protein [Adhaeribacter radiodurans]QMU27760.1 hypothetical protein HUW48_06745 [Adhaeribacter radiodurans]